MKKHIPNLLTCGNLLAGSLAVVFTLYHHRADVAMALIVLAAVFDFFDGLVARALGVSSPIGKDLDSLADVVSFGLAPATLVWYTLQGLGITSVWSYGVFLLVAFAALRLAKFNNDTRQSTSFLGLPVPSNALFFLGYTSSLPMVVFLLGPVGALVVTLVLTLLFGSLMLGELPMFSFKLTKAPLRALWKQIALVVVSVISILIFGWAGCSIAIAFYLFLSLLPASEH
ncbi:MAG: CDP-alcohol phosphatidyltransferase family protein [Porphyromonadaceae bacterium]|nr:CDP-alcohol phosphatidyltransferase family protein [Porphyromonadaceae bacterium]